MNNDENGPLISVIVPVYKSDIDEDRLFNIGFSRFETSATMLQHMKDYRKKYAGA